MSKHIFRSATFALNCQFPPKRSIKPHHQSFHFQFQYFESNHQQSSVLICIAKKSPEIRCKQQKTSHALDSALIPLNIRLIWFLKMAYFCWFPSCARFSNYLLIYDIKIRFCYCKATNNNKTKQIASQTTIIKVKKVLICEILFVFIRS